MVIAPGRRPHRYAAALLEPSLTDGSLSIDERQTIGAYEQRLFRSEWEADAQGPAPFLPPSDRQPVGSVTEAETVQHGPPIDANLAIVGRSGRC